MAKAGELTKHQRDAERQRLWNQWADSQISEQMARDLHEAEAQRAAAVAADKEAALRHKENDLAFEFARALNRAERDTAHARDSIAAVFDSARQLQRVRAELGENALHLRSNSLARRLSRYVSAYIETLPTANERTFGEVFLSHWFRPASSWVAAEGVKLYENGESKNDSRSGNGRDPD